MVQPHQGLWFYAPEDGSEDASVHISAVERAGLESRRGPEGHLRPEPGRNGRMAAANIQLAD